MAQPGFYLLLSVRCCSPVSLAAPSRSGRRRWPVRSRRLPAVSRGGEESFSGFPHLCLTAAVEEGLQDSSGRGKWPSDGSLPISLLTWLPDKWGLEETGEKAEASIARLSNFKISMQKGGRSPEHTLAISVLCYRPFSLSGPLFDSLLPLYESPLCALLLQLEEKNILMTRSIQEHGRR